MFSNTEDLLPVISFNAKGSKDEQKKHNDFVARMVDRGYTEKQVQLARRVVSPGAQSAIGGAIACPTSSIDG